MRRFITELFLSETESSARFVRKSCLFIHATRSRRASPGKPRMTGQEEAQTGRVALSKDRLLFGKGYDFPTAVEGRKECLGIEFAAFLGRRFTMPDQTSCLAPHNGRVHSHPSERTNTAGKQVSNTILLSISDSRQPKRPCPSSSVLLLDGGLRLGRFLGHLLRTRQLRAIPAAAQSLH